jgi:ATP-dependent DNA helicase DinG
MSETRYAFIDTEGTSRGKNENEMIEFSILIASSEHIHSTTTSLVKPTLSIPPFVEQLTGIYNHTVLSAPDFESIADTLYTAIGDHCIVGHNVAFDIDLINTSLDRINRPRINNPCIDTQDLCKMLLPHTISHQLSNLATVLNFPVDASHRATNDATATWYLFRYCCEQLTHCPKVLLKTMLSLLNGSNYQAVHDWVYEYYCHHNHTELHPYTHYLNGFCGQKTNDSHTNPVYTISELFSDTLCQLPNYTYRTIQAEMAQECQEAFESGTHTVIESPTGTGKSLAYLIPAILTAVRQQAPIILSTKTKLLQTQLVNTLETLRSIPLPSFSYLIMKGKQNYIDVTEFDALLHRYLSHAQTGKSIEFIGLFYWILHTQTGDLSELHNAIFSAFYDAVHYRAKAPHPVPHCFVHTLRKCAKNTDLVITNHALLFSDYQAKTHLLPKSAGIVFDEAHDLDSVIQSCFDASLIFRPLAHYTVLAPIICDIDDRIMAAIPKPYDRSTDLSISHAWLADNEILPQLHALRQELSELTVHDTEGQTRLDNALDTLSKLLEDRPNYAHWLSFHKRHGATWHSAPIDCAPVITQFIQKAPPLIFTSATLCIGDSFNYFLSTLGLPTSTNTLKLPALFDYINQATAYMCTQDVSLDELANYLDQTTKKTLVLFTAFATLKQAYAHCNKLAPKRILAQRIHGTHDTVLKRFLSQDSPPILFGLDSFWEGVDLPGLQLETVIIQKLPFAPPTHPLIEAKLAQIESDNGNGFMDFLLPKSILKFRQGIGRLIRTTHDSGTLIVLDSRVLSKSYGRLFRQELSTWTCEQFENVIPYQ